VDADPGPDQLDAVAVGKAEVDHSDVRPLGRADRGALAHRPGLDDPAHPVLEPQHRGEAAPDDGVVVDDQDRRRGGHDSAA
jgi:hypothetical protein